MLNRIWRSRGALSSALLPLALIFTLLAAVRRAFYRYGLLRTQRLPVPVVVVGNIVAGGSGKTPLVLWLAQELSQRGWRPGIVSRGYGGTVDKNRELAEVSSNSDPAVVGDEPLLLKRRAGLPVFVGRNRVAVGRAMLDAYPDCNLVLSDDGLQHYRLARDVEIAVIDVRGLMNGWPLPAGPLREPAARLAQVDALVLNAASPPIFSGSGQIPCFRMSLAGEVFYRLDQPAQTNTAAALATAYPRLHAVAGIGEPRRFFEHLAALGLAFTPYAFADHHRYRATDLVFADCDALLMTEKDAVKCAGLIASAGSAFPVIWVLPVAAELEPDLAAFVVEKLNGPPSA